MQEEYLSISQEVQKKFQEWFGDAVPTDIPFPAGADHSGYETRSGHEENLPKLSDLLSFGCGGAVLLGAFVGFILLALNISDYGWYTNDWSNQMIIFAFAMVLGFLGGLFIGIGSLYKLHERSFYKDEI